ncbi:hypothetical protein B0H17DRAFT_1180285 [Mycena rosella]|uniref:Uncharacterized protein n=1 Tax=Mycena rosella TaxID=1033263 RepID=A0AAD7DE31_MYCRO|nr:hypothetical protein B0H17DRAFT_1180285 [Mycena rosella]
MSANKLPFGDSSTAHHMIIAARCTTGAPKELADMFGDFLAVADKVHKDSISKEQANGEIAQTFSNIVEWVKPCKADDQGRQAETLQPKVVPETRSPPRATTKTADAAKADNVKMSPPVTRIGDKYDPDLLPDHRGLYFTHQVSKLVQRDHIDADEKFIAPHELYSQLTEGTLFCAYISFETFIFKEGKYPSKLCPRQRLWQGLVPAHSIALVAIRPVNADQTS